MSDFPRVRRVTLERPPIREDWLAARAPFIGASEAAALFGEHPYLTAGDLALEKLERRELRPETPAMIRGRVLESAVAELYALEHGCELREPSVLYVAIPEPADGSERLGVLCATLDREIVGEPAALEIKTTGAYVAGVERYWYWQAQAQLVCSGFERIEFAVLDASMRLASYCVKPDAHDQAELVARADAFLEYVRAGEIPPGALCSRQTLERLYPDPKVSSVELERYVDEHGREHNPASTVRRLKVARARIKELEQDAKLLEEIVINQLRGATDGTIDGELVISWRATHRNDLDTKRLRAERPEIAAEYARPSTYRTVRVR